MLPPMATAALPLFPAVPEAPAEPVVVALVPEPPVTVVATTFPPEQAEAGDSVGATSSLKVGKQTGRGDGLLEGDGLSSQPDLDAVWELAIPVGGLAGVDCLRRW